MKHAIAQIETDDLPINIARASLNDLALELQSILTQRLTAYMVGLSDGRDIGRYARGERKPHPATNTKLRELAYLVALMREKEDFETIQIWFLGRNPELNDCSPAKMLHDDFNNYPKVKYAIEKFLTSGE